MLWIMPIQHRFNSQQERNVGISKYSESQQQGTSGGMAYYLIGLWKAELRLPIMWLGNQHNFLIKYVKQLLLSWLGRNLAQHFNFFKDSKKKHYCYIYKCSKKILKYELYLQFWACYLHGVLPILFILKCFILLKYKMMNSETFWIFFPPSELYTFILSRDILKWPWEFYARYILVLSQKTWSVGLDLITEKEWGENKPRVLLLLYHDTINIRHYKDLQNQSTWE